MAMITLDLPDDLLAAALAAVVAGQVASIDAFVIDALRAREAGHWDVAALREAIAEGEASGPGIPAHEVFDGLLTELRASARRG